MLRVVSHILLRRGGSVVLGVGFAGRTRGVEDGPFSSPPTQSWTSLYSTAHAPHTQGTKHDTRRTTHDTRRPLVLSIYISED